jgi:hypothetical protein
MRGCVNKVLASAPGEPLGLEARAMRFYKARPDGGFTKGAVQFALGGALSGTPLHWHNDAMNYLVRGAKLWTLEPPSGPCRVRGAPSARAPVNLSSVDLHTNKQGGGGGGGGGGDRGG